MSAGFNGEGADGNTTFPNSGSNECADASIAPLLFSLPRAPTCHGTNIQIETASPSPYTFVTQCTQYSAFCIQLLPDSIALMHFNTLNLSE